MRQRLWVSVVVIAFILAGCGGQAAQPPTGPTTSSGELFQVALPRLVIDVDAEGNPSILGISPALLSAFGVDVAGFKLPKDLVTQFTDASVQHLEIASVGDRLMFFANGKPVPHLGWTTDSLNRMLNLLNTMKVENAQAIQRILPIVTRLGLDVVLRFPRPEGEAEIPFVDTSTVRSFQPTATTDPASLVAKFEVRFDDQGRAGMMTLSPEDLAALGVGSPLSLSPETLANFQAGNIQHMEIRTKPDGAYIYVNNDPLPRLIWDTQLLKNAVDLYGELSPDAQLLPLIQQIAPYLDRADLDVLLRFPKAAGQADIPAELH
ncbi:MAG: hypothetical protein ACM30E_04895 [Nitrososphaerales archaeon]